MEIHRTFHGFCGTSFDISCLVEFLVESLHMFRVACFIQRTSLLILRATTGRKIGYMQLIEKTEIYLAFHKKNGDGSEGAA